MKKIFLVTFIVSTILTTAVAEAKSTTWSSGLLPDYLAYKWSGDNKAWGLGLYNLTANVTRNAYMYRNGVGISDGAVVAVGDTISFTAPVKNSDIAWFATGYSVDSPYGKWIKDAGFPGSVSTFLKTISIDTILGTTMLINVYAEFSVNPSNITYTHTGSTASLSCNASGSTCVVNSPGLILTQVKYSGTYGKYYYKFNGVTTYQAVPMRRILNYSVPGAWYQQVEPNDYKVNIPAQTINFSITAVNGNNSPNTPILTHSAVCTAGSPYTLSAQGTDSDGDQVYYEFDWNNDGVVDARAPGVGFVNSGTLASLIITPAAGNYNVRARTVDSKGGISGWSAAQNITCSPPTTPAIGHFDSVNPTTCSVKGWAFDGDSPASSISVSVYRDGQMGSGGTLVTTCPANQSRPDVNSAHSITGNHGFNCILPASYIGTGNHQLYIHAMDTNGTPNNVIAASPKSLECPAAPPPLLPSANISVTNCSIPSGGASCNSVVSWSSLNTTVRSVRQDGIQFSTAVSSPGVNRNISHGAHTFSFYNNGVLVDSDTSTASCVAGTSWNGTSCQAAAFSCTGSIPANASPWSATEASGLAADTPWSYSVSDTVTKCQYSCDSGYSWDGISCTVVSKPNLTANLPTAIGDVMPGSDITLTSNVQNTGTASAGPYNIRFYIDSNGDGNADFNHQIRENSNTPAGSSQSESDNWTVPANATAGTWQVGYFADIDDEVDESGVDGQWSNWSGWRPFIVTAPPSVNLNVTGCEIAVNESSCEGDVSWTFSNIQAPENYLVKNVTTNTDYGNTQTSGGVLKKPLQSGNNTITASANGVSDTKVVNVDCVDDTAWYGGVCFPPPTISIEATPKLIRSGETTEVKISVNSTNDLACTLYNATDDSPKSFNHNSVQPEKDYDFTTKNITSTQLASVVCLDTVTNLSTTEEVRIEVIPSIEEI